MELKCRIIKATEHFTGLLIVLNGIEIGLLFGLWRTAESFNRTKWN